MNIYLEGPAAVGKTTFLQQFKAKTKYNVICGDFADFSNKMGPLLSREENQLLYMATEFRQRGVIQDRSHLSSLFYKFIFDYLEGRKTLVEIRSGAAYREMKKHLLKMEDIIIVLMPKRSSSSLLLQKYQERNNGVDVLSLGYVHAQYDVFNMMCNDIDVLMRIDIDLTYGSYYPVLENLITSLKEGLPLCLTTDSRRNRRFDGGYDLSAAATVQLKVGLNVIPVRERFFIPPGFVGKVYERSSFSSGIVHIGVIDATYTGTIFVKVTCHKPDILLCNTYFSQLVIEKVVNKYLPVKELPNVCRKKQCFGSTDNKD